MYCMQASRKLRLICLCVWLLPVDPNNVVSLETLHKPGFAVCTVKNICRIKMCACENKILLDTN